MKDYLTKIKEVVGHLNNISAPFFFKLGLWHYAIVDKEGNVIKELWGDEKAVQLQMDKYVKEKYGENYTYILAKDIFKDINQ